MSFCDDTAHWNTNRDTMTRDNSQLGMKISAAALESASEVKAVKIPVDPVRELQRLHDKNADLETRRLANSLMW